MAVFRYSMQNVLNIKYKLETQAKQEFSVAKNALGVEEGKLSTLNERKEQYLEQSRRTLSGAFNSLDLKANSHNVAVMDNMIREQKINVKRAQAVVDKAMEKMTEAGQERKIHEKLRERAFEQFMLEENRKESKIVDELTSYTYGIKRQVVENG